MGVMIEEEEEEEEEELIGTISVAILAENPCVSFPDFFPFLFSTCFVVASSDDDDDDESVGFFIISNADRNRRRNAITV